MGIIVNKTFTPQLSIRQLTAPSEVVVTLQEQKDFGRISGNAENTLIPIFIAAATRKAESYVRGGFIRRTWRQSEDAGERRDPLIVGRFLFGEEFEIEIDNIQLVTVETVTFFDRDNNATIIPSADYRVGRTNDTQPGRVVFKLNTILPTNTRYYTEYEIDYTAGYEDRATLDSIAPDIKLAIMVAAQRFYENREDMKDIPTEAKALLNPYRIMELD